MPRALKEEEGKRYTLGARTTLELNQALKAAAQKNGRSVSQEIELRLEQSFRENELIKIILSEKGAQLLNYTMTALKTSRAKSGENWENNPEIANAVALAFHSMISSCSAVGEEAFRLFYQDKESWRRSKIASNYIAAYTLINFGNDEAVAAFSDDNGAITPGEAIERFIIKREQL